MASLAFDGEEADHFVINGAAAHVDPDVENAAAA